MPQLIKRKVTEEEYLVDEEETEHEVEEENETEEGEAEEQDGRHARRHR